jgi:hypothetical protein
MNMEEHRMSIRPLEGASSQAQNRLAGLAGIIARVLIVGVSYEVILCLIWLAEQAWYTTSITLYATPSPFTPLKAAINIASGALFALVLIPLARRVHRGWPIRILALILPLYWIYTASNEIELFFFTNSHPSLSGQVISYLVALLAALVVATLTAWFFPPSTQSIASSGARPHRSLLSWLWHIVLAGILYVPTYLLFGALIYPVVRPYYNNPAYGLHLVTPPIETWITLEVVRGICYVLALLPVLLVMRGPRWQTSLYLFAVIGMMNSWVPLLLAGSMIWPLTLRLGHTLEITGDALVQGFTIGLLCALPLARRKRQEADNREALLHAEQ